MALPNYGGTLPTDGGDENTWGVENNTLHSLWDATIKTVSNAAAAAQSTADAIGTRTTTLEGKTATGLSGILAGKYFFGATCEGLEEETVTLGSSTVYNIPFDHTGTFDAMMIRGSGTSIKGQVIDSTAGGAPSATVLAEVNFVGSWTGTKVITFTSPITITRLCWLRLLMTGDVYTRGTTGAVPRWRLGSASAAPTTAADVITCYTGAVAPYAAVSLGTKGWGPTMALRSS